MRSPSSSRYLCRRMWIATYVQLLETHWYFLMIYVVWGDSRTHRWGSRHSGCLPSCKGMGWRPEKACQRGPQCSPYPSYLTVSYRKMRFNLRAHRDTICSSAHPYPSASNPIQEPETMDGLGLHWWWDASGVLATAKFVDEISHCMHHPQLPRPTSTAFQRHARTDRWLHRWWTSVRWRWAWSVSITHTFPELVRNGGDVWMAAEHCQSERPWTQSQNICSTCCWIKVETGLCSRGFEHGKYTAIEGQCALDYRLAREWLFPPLVWWSCPRLLFKLLSLMALFRSTHDGFHQDLHTLLAAVVDRRP